MSDNEIVYQNKRTPCDVMSVWGFVWSVFVMAIPVIGLITAVAWACGATKNRSRRRLALGFVIVKLVMCLLVAAAVFFALRSIKKSDTSGVLGLMVSEGYVDYGRIIRDIPFIFTADGIEFASGVVRDSDVAAVAERYLKDGKSIGECAQEANKGKTAQQTVDSFVSSPLVINAASLLVNRNANDAVSLFWAMVADGQDVSGVTEAWLGDTDISAARAIDMLACGARADVSSEEYISLAEAMASLGYMPEEPRTAFPGTEPQPAVPNTPQTALPDTAEPQTALPDTSAPGTEYPFNESPSTSDSPVGNRLSYPV